MVSADMVQFMAAGTVLLVFSFNAFVKNIILGTAEDKKAERSGELQWLGVLAVALGLLLALGGFQWHSVFPNVTRSFGIAIIVAGFSWIIEARILGNDKSVKKGLLWGGFMAAMVGLVMVIYVGCKLCASSL